MIISLAGLRFAVYFIDMSRENGHAPTNFEPINHLFTKNFYCNKKDLQTFFGGKIGFSNLLLTFFSLALSTSSCTDETVTPSWGTSLQLNVKATDIESRGLIESAALPEGHSIIGFVPCIVRREHRQCISNIGACDALFFTWIMIITCYILTFTCVIHTFVQHN